MSVRELVRRNEIENEDKSYNIVVYTFFSDDEKNIEEKAYKIVYKRLLVT